MLCLSRKEGESVLIGGIITVTNVGVRSHDKVRLGVDAPRTISVQRLEASRNDQDGRIDPLATLGFDLAMICKNHAESPAFGSLLRELGKVAANHGVERQFRESVTAFRDE